MMSVCFLYSKDTGFASSGSVAPIPEGMYGPEVAQRLNQQVWFQLLLLPILTSYHMIDSPKNLGV